jgi:hypothetical protein
LAKALDGNVWLNQGTPGATSWVNWLPLNIASKVGPAASSSGNRTIAIVTSTDNRVMYDWWDLGGGGHGFREIPGGFRTDTSAAAALVNGGGYAFVLAKALDGSVYLNQGAPGGAWVGWRPMNIVTKVAPSAGSSGNRSIAVITGTNGRIMYDWWDLGGGGHGFREIPGTFQTDASVAVAMVDNGGYTFTMAKGSEGGLSLNQGDATTGKWVGWVGS